MYHMKEFLSIDSLSHLIWNPSEGRSMMLSPVLDILYSQNTLHCSCFFFWGTCLTLCLWHEISHVTQIEHKPIVGKFQNILKKPGKTTGEIRCSHDRKIITYLYNIFASNTRRVIFPFQREMLWTIILISPPSTPMA